MLDYSSDIFVQKLLPLLIRSTPRPGPAEGQGEGRDRKRVFFFSFQYRFGAFGKMDATFGAKLGSFPPSLFRLSCFQTHQRLCQLPHTSPSSSSSSSSSSSPLSSQCPGRLQGEGGRMRARSKPSTFSPLFLGARFKKETSDPEGLRHVTPPPPPPPPPPSSSPNAKPLKDCPSIIRSFEMK